MARFDNIGMFWQDLPDKGSKIARKRIMPPIPDTGWVPPRDWPNLSAARVLSVDVETYDPELNDHGPGWARRKGHVCGFSVGADGGGRWYFPIRHEVEPEWNMNPDHALRWLKDTLERNPNVPLVGANLIYDLGWLWHEGIYPVTEEYVDIQFAEALLDSQANFALEDLAQKYLGVGKVHDLLQRWIMDYYSPPKKFWRREIYRSPPRLAGPYGEGDADLPLRIAPLQYPLLQREGLLDLFQMECSLIPLLVEMRYAGVTVDVGRAEQLRDELNKRIKVELAKIKSLVGRDVNVNSSDQLAKAFDKFDLKYPRNDPTKKQLKLAKPGEIPLGSPSFKGDFLKKVDHPLAKSAHEVKRLSKLNGTFVEGYVLNGNVNGKIYCSFHPLKGESGGTGVGRFSSSDPNLQNIPVRDKELGPLIRGLFHKDPGHLQWRKYDYSQIQYRFLVEYAVGPGAEEARQKYINNPDTDYHDMVLHLVERLTGRKWDRRPVKNLNFGLSFGMGDEKASASTGLKGAELKQFLDAYHKAAPFGKATMKHFMNLANRQGYIRTVLNRKAVFNLWEPDEWGTDRDLKPALPYDQAIRAYGKIKRAYLHKSMASFLQGCEGDMMKAAMARAYKEGVFRYIGVPRLLVHDEFDFSDPGGKEDGFTYFQHILQTVIKTRVPILAECDIGPTDWGNLEPLKKAA